MASASNPFSYYCAEILRAEGFNAFAVADVSNLSASLLSGYEVVLLGDVPLTAAQVTMLTDWVNAGGDLIAMRPDKQLAPLLGLTDLGTTLSEGYLLVDTSTPPGCGHRGGDDPVPRHRRPLHGSTVRPWSPRSTRTHRPPRRTRPSRGAASGPTAEAPPRSPTIWPARSSTPARATRPGPARSATAVPPMRSNDLFYGDAAGDPQPDWVNLDKVAIPQADEQQRLLANLIPQMTLDRQPLPRFWYFPRGRTAVVVMTGDDHGGGDGTVGPLRRLPGDEPAGCSVDDWECVRAHLLPLQRVPERRRGGRLRGRGLRGGAPRRTRAARTGPRPRLEAIYLDQLASWRLPLPVGAGARDQPHPLHRVERLGDPGRGRAQPRHPPRHQLLLLAARAGCRTAPACSPARACRCASPTSTAR